VGAIRSEVVEEPRSVLGLHGNACRPRRNRAGAPTEAPPVVTDALETLECWFGHDLIP
jgi:hypothetical protein